MDLLTKHLLASGTEKVKAISYKGEEAKSISEEQVNYFINRIGFFSANGQKNQGENQQKDNYYDKASYKDHDKRNWKNKDSYKNDQSGLSMPLGNCDKRGDYSGKSHIEEIMAKVMKSVESTQGVNEIKSKLSLMSQLLDLYYTFTK